MTQELSDVCDPNFKPKTGGPNEQQLLTEKQNFVYAVQLKTIQTDYGRSLVREPKHDKDAQQILYELHQRHTASELSRAEVLRLTTYVANLKLTDNWRGTTTQLHLHFREQLRQLDSLVPLMNNSLTPPGWHSCRELWKVFLTSEESGCLMV